MYAKLSPPASPSRPGTPTHHRPGTNRPSLLRPVHFLIARFRLVLLVLALGLLIYYYAIETHVQIAFYRRGWVSQLLPPDPPLVSNTCFSPAYLANPFDPQPDSFPSSPSYNLSLGTLGLRPKVLSLMPGFDLPHYDDCYRFASTLPPAPTPAMAASLQTTHTTYFHLYWRSDLAPITDRQLITLKSLLATQDFSRLPSGRRASQLVLWTNPSARSLENDPLLAPLAYRFRDQLSLRVLDLGALTRGTPMENHAILPSVFDKRAWLDGDLVRVLLLWQYGGFWIDMDNLVLRDLRVLGEHEWVVMWDCYDNKYEPLNGHMMHFFKHSPYLCEMMNLMSLPPAPRPASTDWGQHLYHRLYRSLLASGVTPFKVLPFCLTDGRSCTLRDRLPDPFASVDEERHWRWTEARWKQVRNRLKGVFSIHLHNQWNKNFAPNSWLRRMYIDKWDAQLV